MSCGKDQQPCLWFTENGMRIGTFVGHNGAVWSCDMNADSSRLITASADSSVRIWNMNGGEELFKFALNEPCRAISFALGARASRRLPLRRCCGTSRRCCGAW
jgi:translation initiation factor 3 subunit I